MTRKVPNWTAKRIKPAAKEMTNVVIVVPALPCAAPAAPLMVPLMMLAMPDIVFQGCVTACFVLGIMKGEACLQQKLFLANIVMDALKISLRKVVVWAGKAQ